MIEITYATIRVVGPEGMEAWERLQKEFGSLIHIHYSDIRFADTSIDAACQLCGGVGG